MPGEACFWDTSRVLSPEGIEEELAYFNDRWTIEVSPVTDWDIPTEGEPKGTRLVKVTTDLRAQIAEAFARNFKRETRFDTQPYTARDLAKHPEQDSYLIPSDTFTYMFPIACGGLSVIRTPKFPVLRWVWIHPFQRVQHPLTWTRTWEALEDLYPGLCIEAPLTPPMTAWVQRRGLYDAGRIVS